MMRSIAILMAATLSSNLTLAAPPELEPIDVNVVNSEPLEVAELNGADDSRVQIIVNLRQEDGESSVSKELFIPVGKRLVIEQINVQAQMQRGQAPLIQILPRSFACCRFDQGMDTLDPAERVAFGDYATVPPLLFESAFNNDYRYSTETVNIFIDGSLEDPVLFANTRLSEAIGINNVSLAVFGRLVDIPDPG